MAAPEEPYPIDADSRLAQALEAAHRAYGRGSAREMDRQYCEAVKLAAAEWAPLATTLAMEHVSRLRDLNDRKTALARCEEHLERDWERVQLRLLCAETRLTTGDSSRIDTEIDEIDRIVAGRKLRPVDAAQLSRLRGIAAARRHDTGRALRLLSDARDMYTKLGQAAAVSKVDQDIAAVELPRGNASKAVRAANGSPEARLTRAEALRMVGRYEQARDELDLALRGPLDPSVAFQLLYAKVRLLRLLHSEEAGELMPDLYSAASTRCPIFRACPSGARCANARADSGGPAAPRCCW
jgi:tetratricopeptide (TPR) repeat protein